MLSSGKGAYHHVRRAVRAVVCLSVWLFGLLSGWSVQAEGVLRVAVINERVNTPSTTLAEMTDFYRRLGRQLAQSGIELAPLQVVDSIDQLAALVKRREVDAFFEGTFATLDITHQNPDWQPQLLMWRKGQRDYYSVFFVRDSSPVQDLSDLSGSSIVFESARSTSAFHLPRLVLEQAGYQLLPEGQATHPPRYLLYRFADSEENQAYWVERGRADIGAFNNGDWDRLPASLRQRLRIVGQTPPVPRWLFTLDTRLPAAVQNAARQALLQLMDHEDDRQALLQASGVTRIEALNEADIANLRHWSGVVYGH